MEAVALTGGRVGRHGRENTHLDQVELKPGEATVSDGQPVISGRGGERGRATRRRLFGEKPEGPKLLKRKADSNDSNHTGNHRLNNEPQCWLQ